MSEKISITVNGKIYNKENTFKPLDEIKVNGSKTELYYELFDGNLNLVDKGKSKNPETFLQGKEGICTLKLTDMKNGWIKYFKFFMKPQTQVLCGNKYLDNMVPLIRNFFEYDYHIFNIYGKIVKGYRSPDTDCLWLRDHVHQSKGFQYFEEDMKSFLTHMFDMQMEDGAIYDGVGYIMENSKKWAFQEEKNAKKWGHRSYLDKKNLLRWFRCDVEADVEYLAVEGVYRAFKVTGDLEWAFSLLEKLDRALSYCIKDKNRWSKKHGLIKRPFTIDTWDYVFNPLGKYSDPKYHTLGYKETTMNIMFGDNSGFIQSARFLAELYKKAGEKKRALYWIKVADNVQKNLFKYCWNGKFFRHQVHIDPPVEKVPVNEEKQLSLSNSYTLNRGCMSIEQMRSVINEYKKRRKEKKAFAEWYSIDPCFPDYSFHEPRNIGWTINYGEYTNGGILPLVGGELSQGAFKCGEEEYGTDILLRYARMIFKTGETYLWYHHDGTPGKSAPTTLPTDGWGSGAMLAGLIEGLSGITDRECCFLSPVLSPRFETLSNNKNIYVCAYYPSSKTYIGYRIEKNRENIILKIAGSKYKNIILRYFTGKTKNIKNIYVNKIKTDFKKENIYNSGYIISCIPYGTGAIVELLCHR